MKFRAKTTDLMIGGLEKGKPWILKGKIYDLQERDGEYEFRSEIDSHHFINEEFLHKYFEDISVVRPKICEILGVGLEEKFNAPEILNTPLRFAKLSNGCILVRDNDSFILPQCYIIDLIEHPELIQRIPKYTDEQKEIFKALKVLGYKYIARDSDYDIYAYEKKPVKKLKYYWSSDDIVSFELETSKILNAPHLNFIDWKDEEPFEIPEVE